MKAKIKSCKTCKYQDGPSFDGPFDEAQKGLDKEEQQQKLEGSLKHLHQEIIEHIHPYVTTKIEKVLK